ncbi:hypothetical protein MIR68_007898 [Amoeboaphelidium protococcarum]|nr:hypothetical protein MIR68_007898 [Amoeboaphelidium protococcarum]KAI3642883.1 hypothetical protein MP228_012438 [Amoeboaphelidium protococcarum]
MSQPWLEQQFIKMSQSHRDFMGSEIERLVCMPPLLNLCKRIYKNHPFVISNASPLLPGIASSDMLDRLKDNYCTVSLTPDGLADCVISGPNDELMLALPYETRVKFSEAIKMIKESRRGQKVAYIQSQNDNIHSEFNAIRDCIHENVPVVADVMESSPEAINLWIGSEQSISSLHCDHYENFYYVLEGSKVFTLFPPIDSYFMTQDQYNVGQYDASLHLKHNGQQASWSTLNPSVLTQKILNSASSKSLSTFPRPYIVEVKAGEMLYLPSLWFHQVEQKTDDRSQLCVAINYWYDMEFGTNYCLGETLRDISSSYEPTIKGR